MTGRQPLRIRADDAALMLGCSVRLAQKLLASGKIEGAKIGAIWTTTPAAIEAFIRKNTPEPYTAPPTSTNVAPSGGRVSRSTVESSVAAYERRFGRKPESASVRSSK